MRYVSPHTPNARRQKPSYPVLTAAQREALLTYAREHGPAWKDDLLNDWRSERARVGGRHSPELQQVRNNFGPGWLSLVSLADIIGPGQTPNASSHGRTMHLPGRPGHTLCGEEAHAGTVVPSVTESTCHYCAQEWERGYARGHEAAHPQHTPNAHGGPIQYVLKQLTPDGLWVSDVFSAETNRHVAQAVIAGALFGQPRWAETPDGRFLYGTDAKGKEMRAVPLGPHSPPLTPNAGPKGEVDRHAATELVLFIDNTADLSLGGPRGQGRSVLLNALRKWRKGSYDPALAVKLFEYLAEAGARRYVQENHSSLPWNQMFNVPTRREAARQLEESFRSAAEHGEYDDVDTKIGQ